MDNPIVFFGTDEFSVIPLRWLLDEGFNVVAVVTKPDKQVGRGRKVRENPVVELYKKCVRFDDVSDENCIKNVYDLEKPVILQPEKVKEIIPFLQELKAKYELPLVGVLASFGKIVPYAVLEIFEPVGIVNIHPSLLPKYRGPTPIETAMLNGDKTTGVSLMKLAPEMDAGGIFAQKHYEITDDASKNELYDALARLGAEMLTKDLPKIATGQITAMPQDETEAAYTHLLTKEMSWLQPEKYTAVQIVDQIRAFQGFPKPKININGITAIILAAHAADAPVEPAVTNFRAVDGRFVVIDTLLPENGKPMSAAAFANGLHERKA
ncbi:MAG: methionyl-tRNA formyltransferase [Candidatus Nomurabacteria bacterium]|jgi:methionyl-tRNA formyltransferase|nr:methionyl-tRNA formyltransferase [Candidatus Nomurabacteria bacterium]